MNALSELTDRIEKEVRLAVFCRKTFSDVKQIIARGHKEAASLGAEAAIKRAKELASKSIISSKFSDWQPIDRVDAMTELAALAYPQKETRR